jgi:hypothetical protein
MWSTLDITGFSWAVMDDHSQGMALIPLDLTYIVLIKEA